MKLNSIKTAVGVTCVCVFGGIAGCGESREPTSVKSKEPYEALETATEKIVCKISDKTDAAKKTAAQAYVRVIDEAVVVYNLEHRKLPSALKDLITASGDNEPILKGGEDAIQDPWGTEYRLEKKGRKYAIVSAGPDGTFGTEDDILSKKEEKTSK